jgi:hypothetical protein
MLVTQNAVAIEYVEYPNGSIGERFLPASEENLEVLSPEEMASIQSITARFQDSSSQSIVFESHLEAAWKQNVDSRNPGISYLKYAFDLGKF